jgi:hypothetical protein
VTPQSLHNCRGSPYNVRARFVFAPARDCTERLLPPSTPISKTHVLVRDNRQLDLSSIGM